MDMEDLAQTAFSAYVDAVQDAQLDPHQRLEVGSRAAAVAVHGHIREERKREAHPRFAKHGTYSGYSSGCRCQWCMAARRAYEGAFYHHRGKNAIRNVTLTS